MNQHVTHLLPDYILGLLPAFSQKEVEVHAANCSECRHSLQQERRFTTQIQQTINAIPMPAHAALKRLQPAMPQSRTWGNWLPQLSVNWQMGFALAGLLLFMVVGSFNSRLPIQDNPLFWPAPLPSEAAATATKEPTQTATSTIVVQKVPASLTPKFPATPIAALYIAP